MSTLKKPNRLLAPLTTNTAMMAVMKIGATMTTTTVVTTKTTAKMIMSPSVMTAQRAQGADKAAITGLITRSTPPILKPSAPMMLTLASY